ncbi:zinc-finger associated domain containing protein [Oryctes borbonicus]|uniref:Zinc-finger associated domain containing protein n=1 Tax=Oryctes borbonicus TaxID=1629725 RepID=A0A0T6B3Y5_9SCAR|nr:zinc-finger associated domain containing protein [Oryctes borbonicus]
MGSTEEWRGYATICRLCLQKDGFMLGIFNHIQGKEKSIYKKIMDCTALEISFGDGLPTCICHRCLYKIEFCLDFRQQCFVSDATLRQINGLTAKQLDNGSNFNDIGLHAGTEESDVVMVVDPHTMDYDSEYETDTNERHSDAENLEVNDMQEFRNVFLCKYCDQAFTEKAECCMHESNNHNPSTPYVCSDCDMTFADRINYSAHLKSVHQNDKPYNCPQCERNFARRSDLRKHTVVHTGIKPFTCSICLKSFSRNTNLSKHMRIHSGQKPFVCQKCPKTFITKADLTRHTIIHTGQKPFKCTFCNLSFGRRDKLLRHERKHFPQEKKDNSEELQMLRENLSMNDFGYMKEENPVINTANEIEQEKSSEWVSSENMVINLDPYNHNNYGHGENASTSETNLEIGNGTDTDLPRVPDHIRPESGDDNLLDGRELPLIPEHITGDSFTDNNSSADNAEASRPPIEKLIRHPCLVCHKRFSSIEGLRVHMDMHTGNRPHPCHICNKSFMRKRELDRHIATHTGMKPFKCTSCDKRFGRKDKLVRHMRIHDVNREHICIICGASFNRKDGLTHHMKTHVKDDSEILNNI